MSPAPTGWSVLLDRLEERLRRLEALAAAAPGVEAPDPGPEPVDADRPSVRPTPDEHLRLLALLQAHERVERRLTTRRDRLRQAQHYHASA